MDKNNVFEGMYETFDDKSNVKQARVEFYKKNNKLFAKMVDIYSAAGYSSPDPSCTKCKDDRKGQKVRGIEFIRDLTWNGKEWGGGTILNPQDGKTYNLKVWMDEKNQRDLTVRVFLGPFYRTQIWRKAKA